MTKHSRGTEVARASVEVEIRVLCPCGCVYGTTDQNGGFCRNIMLNAQRLAICPECGRNQEND